MAEVAAAASGAGLASLAIQCCKGLTAYYSSYKAYNEQIGAIHEGIEVLTSLFEKWERVLSRNIADPAQEPYVQQLNSIIALCRARLQKLQSVLENCQRTALPNSTSARLRNIKSQALFPFKEHTLLTLRENVQSLREDLQLALHVFQTDIGLGHQQSIASLAAASRSVEIASQNTQSDIQAIAGPVHRMDTTFDLLLQQGEDTTTRLSEMHVQMRQHQENTLNLSRTISDQYRLLLQRDRVSPGSLQHELITTLVEFGAEKELLRNEMKLSNQKREVEAEEAAARMDVLNQNIMKLQLGAISRPSLLQSAERENHRLSDYVSQCSEPEVGNGQDQLPFLLTRRRKCNCNARYAKSSSGKALLTSRYGQLFGHEWLFRSGTYSTRLHHRTCPMYPSSPTVATARLSMMICGALLNRAVEASISITRGAGGCSISQTLHCPRVVFQWSKAFNLVGMHQDSIPSISDISDWKGFLDRITQELEHLFQEGQASPHDVDLQENTLLHIAGCHLDNQGVLDLARITGLPPEVILQSMVAFCESLHDLGVPLNWTSRSYPRERLFVHPLIEEPPSYLDPDILSHSLNRLCKMGLELTGSTLNTGCCHFDPAETHYYQVTPTNAFPKCRDIIDGLCHNEIHEAIIHRSITHLQAALQRSCNSIDESSEAGYTPLHLASNWPCGLSLLLSHGADLEPRSYVGQTPIELAMLQGCTEAVQRLLRAGCRLPLSLGSNVFEFAVRLLQIHTRRLPTPALHDDYFEIVKIIIQELVLRRRSPMSKMINAPLIHRSRFSMSDSGQILDSGTAQTETFLQSVDRTAPQLQSTLAGILTVYHCPFLTVKVADELWSAGFREVDVPDDYHKTPLMVLQDKHWSNLHSISDTIEFAFWLYKKGASICRPYRATLQSDSRNTGKRIPRFERRAIHFLVAALSPFVVREAREEYWIRGGEEADIILGYNLPARLQPLIDDLNLDCRRFLDKIMLDVSPDGCLCACSGHGCMPTTYFVKRKRPFRQCSMLCYRKETQRKFISEWVLQWLFDNVSSGRFPVAVNRGIVRLVTFEHLGLRHTCCDRETYRWNIYPEFYSVDPEEAAEIRDEDREGIQLLESLLPEFEEKLGDEDLKPFLCGYWVTRMKEVLAARDNEPVDVTGLREAGVVVHDWNLDDGTVDEGSVDEGSADDRSVDDDQSHD